MEKKDFFFLGKIIKTSGYKGSLVFFFDTDEPQKYGDLEAVFIKVNGDLIPFVISELKYKSGNTFFASLEDITTAEEAETLVNTELYLPMAYLPKLSGKKFYYHEIIGFKVVDITKGEIGKVEEVYDQSSQTILGIRHTNGKEILIPASDEILSEVDRKNNTLKVDAPDGLIELYL